MKQKDPKGEEQGIRDNSDNKWDKNTLPRLIA